jgi:hypothetical protein
MNDEEKRRVIRQVLASVACDLKVSAEFYAKIVDSSVEGGSEYFQGASDAIARAADEIANVAKRI